jgi:hypothetical protein
MIRRIQRAAGLPDPSADHSPPSAAQPSAPSPGAPDEARRDD